jgi:hypothetical protein
LSRGNRAWSMTSTDFPVECAVIAAAIPAGPAPTTMASHRFALFGAPLVTGGKARLPRRRMVSRGGEDNGEIV